MVRRRAVLLSGWVLLLLLVMGLILMAGRAATEAALVAIRVEGEEVVVMIIALLGK